MSQSSSMSLLVEQNAETARQLGDILAYLEIPTRRATPDDGWTVERLSP